MAYEPKLPEGQALPPGFSVNTGDPRYKALHDLATRENLSQRAFSAILGVEAQRVTSEYERARSTPAAAPAPAPKPALPANFDKLSVRDQMAHALQRGAAPRELVSMNREHLPVYHRTRGGSVTLNAMFADERAFAVEREPWRWSLSPRDFAPWPPDRIRGEPVTPPSLADAMPRSPKMWDLTK